MKFRILTSLAIGVAVLAVFDTVMALQAVWAAWQTRMRFATGGSGGGILHDTYVVDGFGLPWWVMPAVLQSLALALFVWSRRASRHDPKNRPPEA